MRIHGIRDKTFPSPVPQLNKNYKNGTLTKNRSRDEELAFAQTTSSLPLKSALRFLLFLQPLHSHRSGFIPYSVKVASNRKFFCDSVLKYPGSVRQTITRECGGRGRNPDHREALFACLYHICRIRARQGCVAPKGQGLDAP